MRESGQGTVEWIGLVALVTTIVASGAALSQAPFVGHTITRQYARALCIVSSGDCERDRDPCVTRADEKSSSSSLSLFIVDLHKGKQALVEQRSDGTIMITRVDTAKFGAKLRFGLGGSVSVGSKKIAVGGEISRSMAASAADGKSWVVRSEGEARQLLDQLDGGDDVPPVAISYGRLGMDRTTAGSLMVGKGKRASGLNGNAKLDRDAGVRIDHRTGAKTLYFAGDAGHKIDRHILGRARTISSADAGAGETYAVELDPDGRPVDLQIATLSDALPDIASPFRDTIDAEHTSSQHRRYETTAHLDLTDPVSLAAAQALIGALRAGRAAPIKDTAGRVRERVGERGTVEVRVLDVSGGDDGGFSASGTVAGVHAGASRSKSHQGTRLLAAASRGLDGNWVPRDDCVMRGIMR